MVPARTARAVLTLLALVAIGLLLLVVWPFVTPLFIAAVLAGALTSWMEWLTRALGGRRPLASGVLGAVVGPLSGLGAVLVPQMVSGFQWIRSALLSEGIAGLVQRVPA